MKIARRPLRIGLVFALVTLVLVGEWAYLRASDARSERPDADVASVTLAPFDVDFSLNDHNGRAMTIGDLGDRHALVLFGYTHCPDVCPTELANLATLLDDLGDQASDLSALFITVDPERDTPEVLAHYVSAFHPRIVGLTGTAEQVAAVTEAYRVFYARAEVDADFYLMDHSSALYLMGRDGRFLTAFSSTTLPEDMAARIRGYIVDG